MSGLTSVLIGVVLLQSFVQAAVMVGCTFWVVSTLKARPVTDA